MAFIPTENVEDIQELEFHSFYHNEITNFGNMTYSASSTDVRESIDSQFSSMRETTAYVNGANYDEIDPPLLEELEIYPERILQNALAMLYPFHRKDLLNDEMFENVDLAGPILFCVVYGSCLLVSGKKMEFGSIYGLSLISVIGMYALLMLMCNKHRFITMSRVASVLGYGILPILWLSIIGIFVSLNSLHGFILAAASICLATMGVSRVLCLMIGEPKHRMLIAYPTALVYFAFTLLALF